jgi:multidrug resistance efflux pump
MNKSHLISFTLTAALGLASTGLVLFAWEMPPFSARQPTTENAYVRGKVTNLSPQIAGYISEVLVTDFQHVNAGDVLFRLDDSSLKQKLRQAEAGLVAARANHDAAVSTLRATELATHSDASKLEAAHLTFLNAEIEAKRQHSLREQGVLSKSSTEQADLSLSKANAQFAEVRSSLDAQQEKLIALKNQVSAADATIQQAEATVALAQIDLQHVEIAAPTDGTMGQISARVGQYVNAATTLTSHVGTERWVIANFTETNFERLSVNQSVSISVDALGGRKIDGQIGSFSPATGSEFSVMSGTNATGNFTKVVQRIPVRIEIDAEQSVLKDLVPGMSVVAVAR